MEFCNRHESSLSSVFVFFLGLLFFLPHILCLSPYIVHVYPTLAINALNPYRDFSNIKFLFEFVLPY